MKTAYIIFLLGIFCSKCYPDADLEEPCTVITDYDPGFNFFEQTGFYVIDTVLQVGANDSDFSRSWNRSVLYYLEQGLLNRGLHRSDSLKHADLILHVAVLGQSRTDIDYNFYESWRWAYTDMDHWISNEGFTEKVYLPNYEMGTVIIKMGTLRFSEDVQETDLVWLVILADLLEEENVNNALVKKAVDQAFTQSPYL